MPGSDDLMAGLNELVEAQPGYEKAWDYWESEVPERFDSPVWRRIMSKSEGGNFRLNFSKIPIVSLSDRLRVSSVVALDSAGAKDVDADAALQDRVWTANKLVLQTKSLTRKTLVYGDSYWSIWPGDTEQSVRINYNSPTTTRAIYDPDDQLVMLYVIRRFVVRGVTRATIVYPDRVEQGWVLREGGEQKDAKSWDREADAKDLAHPYGRPPVWHFRTDLPYGCPEARDAWGAQDAINKTTATLGSATERAGLADRYMLTEPNAALNGNTPNTPEWDDEEDGNEDNRNNSAMRTGPGEVAVLEGIRAVGEWSTPNPQHFRDTADWFAGAAAKVTRVSSRYADPGGQHPSGAALRAADAPEAAKAEDRRDYIDEELRDALSFALGVAGYPDRTVDVRWKPSGVVDDLDTWAIVEAKRRNRVPDRVALLETGMYEPEEVDAWLEDGHPEDLAMVERIAIAGDLGAALSQLGQAVAVGLLDETLAKRFVERTLEHLIPTDTTDTVDPAAAALTGEPDQSMDGVPA